ncbi:transmembrane protein 14C-like [Tubulanus polymorphus]|uniref:transmembrane protein 14C-like n=1 Tax=Tubulanus polymorphus TaxID=672921 RepID=UPI003DA2C169
MSVDYIGYGYAAFIALGGIFGYVKAGSTMSLLSGLVCGGLLGVGAFQLSENPQNVHLALGTSVFLSGMMGFRFVNSGKFMPAGMVAVVSVLMAVRLGCRLMQ